MEILGIIMIVSVAIGWLWITREQQLPEDDE